MLKVLSELNLVRFFLLAIIIRLLIMPFYFHPDIKTYNFQSSFLKNGIFNIYTYLYDNKQQLALKEEFVYFPLTYFSLGTYQILVGPLLGPDFHSWLSDASSEAVNKAGTFRYLFILKFPYLILDLLIPFLLIKFFKDLKQKRTLFILWLFNPLSLAIIYFYSNIDIIPVLLSVLALLFFRNKKIILSGLALGIAAGFKPYPLILLPFLLIYLKNSGDFLRMLFTVLTTLILIVAPFWSNAFLGSALISGLTTRIAFPSIPLGFGESLMVGVLALSTLFFLLLTESKKNYELIWIYVSMVFLILLSSIHFHIQWLLWTMPFLSLFIVFSKPLAKLIYFWLGLSFIIPMFYDDKSMTVSLLSAISPLYNLLPTPFLITQKIYDPFILSGILHSIIFGVTLVIIYRNSKYINYEQK